tara:strand:- start:764 stop:904 length:141 start_codon:yes stop_codon:yes gene_type:complete
MSKWTLEFIIVNPIAAFREIERLQAEVDQLKFNRDIDEVGGCVHEG